jgi:hypothetical protein
MDFVHRQEFYILENTTFWKLDLFPSLGKRKEIPTLLGPLEKANLDGPVIKVRCFQWIQ